MSAPPHIVLVGMMGAGKTSVGQALAARLGVRYADNDDELRARTGDNAASLAGERGNKALHRVEYEILKAAVRRSDGAVIGAPASVALDWRAPALLAPAYIVWLRARPETLAARVQRDAVRPLLGNSLIETLIALAAQRQPGFELLADATVDVDGMSVAAIVDRLLERFTARYPEVAPRRGEMEGTS